MKTCIKYEDYKVTGTSHMDFVVKIYCEKEHNATDLE